jgi:hypothetical protein
MTDQKPHGRVWPSLAPKLVSIEASWDVANPEIEKNARTSKTNDPFKASLPNLHLKAPIFLRDDAIRGVLELDDLPHEAYVKLASCIHQAGGAMLATVEQLSSVPLREIPFRIAPMDARSMPNLDSLLSADAIELQLGDWSRSRANPASNASLRSLRIEWPLDTPDWPRFAKKIELLRRLSNGRVPIGVSIPIGDPSEAGMEGIRWLSDIDIDYLTIRSAAACLGRGHPAISYFQLDLIEWIPRLISLFQGPGKRSVAIAIDHPWSDGFQAGQAILSGASFVGIGSFLANLIPRDIHSVTSRSADALASGLLGRSSTPSTASLSYFLQKVDHHSVVATFVEQLRSCLEYSK